MVDIYSVAQELISRQKEYDDKSVEFKEEQRKIRDLRVQIKNYMDENDLKEIELPSGEKIIFSSRETQVVDYKGWGAANIELLQKNNTENFTPNLWKAISNPPSRPSYVKKIIIKK